MNPLVSIIVTTYNYADYLPTAIRSTIAQSYKNIEMIVVNDGSTDNTSEVIQPYLQKIKYIEQANSGVVAARNNGAKMAGGEFILFLDADDSLPPEFIEVALKSLENNPDSSFVYGDRQVFGVAEFRQPGREWNPHLLQVINFVGLSSLIKKSAFDAVGGFSLELNRSKSYEDWDFWLKLSGAGFKGHYEKELYYNYQLHEGDNRNQAGVLQKGALRLQVARRHWRMYVRPGFLASLPGLLIDSSINKRKLLQSKQGTK